MRRALALARRGMGRTSPNPLVGAVVVRAGVVVGEGYHVYDQREHAESVALERAGRRARGSTLYVNLEPCTHYGRTPPCVDRIIEAGVSAVFVATRDPNRLVAGKGIRMLRSRGVAVSEGLCRQQARRLNEKFFYFIRHRRPFVLLKLALTLDGKIAAPGGESQWITGARSRKEAHRLRYEYDAVLVGVGTLLKDDPSLGIRWVRRRPTTRVILDSRLRTPAGARLFQLPDPVVIFHGPRASLKRKQALSCRGARLVCVQSAGKLLDWYEILDALGAMGITSLLVEGGSRVAASALRAGVAQKVTFFYAPRILGATGLCGVGDLGIETLQDALGLEQTSVKRLSPDFVVEGYLRRKAQSQG